MRNRVILCLLSCGVLMYYAVPRISIHFSGLDGIFGFAWLILALLVIGGNLSGLLYSVKKQREKVHGHQLRTEKARRYLRQH